MPTYTTDKIRNIALVGQSNSGKTLLVEALLKQAGAIQTMGSIVKGNTVCDFDQMEKSYQHSLKSSIVSMDHDSIHVNLIDTPGLPDFIGQSICVFPAVETIAVVVNAQFGIEMITRRMLEWAADRKLCRMIIINKIDAPGVDLPALVSDIQNQFGAECLPVNLPSEGARKVVDCFFKPEGEADFSNVNEAHTQIVDQVVEVDEELMELYLEQGEELSPAQLHEPFEKALREGHLVPICFTSAETEAGVPELVRVFEQLMPSPLEGNPQPFLVGEGENAEEFYAEPDPDKHVIAHVFKVTADPFVGKLSMFRVHQGTITPASQLYISDGRKPFKVSHIIKLQGKEQSEISKAIPGDICAVAKVEEIHFDAVLHDSHEQDFLHLKPLVFPVPVYGLAFTPKTRGEEQRLSTAMQRVVEEDPCLKVDHDTSLNETVLRGLGDLHLRFAFEGMKQRFGVEAETRPPRVSYRETIAKPAEGHHRHKKQTGGAGQFAEVYLRIRPLERGAGYNFANKVHGGAIPSQFIPAVEKGVQQAMESGAVAGYKMQDIEIEVYDGKDHPVDSKEVAFVAAGKKAFLDAVAKAKPLVLEPIVSLDVSVPSEFMGGITSEISVKRGQLLGTEALANGELSIKAQAPLSELTTFEAEMKSITGGHGTYTLEFSHYQPVPPQLQKQLASQYQAGGDEE